MTVHGSEDDSPRRHDDEDEEQVVAQDEVSVEQICAASGVSLSEKSTDCDGHRPTLSEICSHSRSRSRSRNTVTLPDATGVADVGGALISRRDTFISRIRSRRHVPRFTHPLDHCPTASNNLVDFDGPKDPYHPLNWRTRQKVITTGLYGFVTMSATWASSSYAAGTREVAKEFHVGTQTAVLGTTLFLVGFGIGPLLWAPLSEVYGRRIAVLAPMFIAICFTFATATAKDFQTLMITRFFSAFFSSAPVTNTGGVLGDIYPASTRAMAMAGYAMAVVAGPTMGMNIPL